MSLQSHSQLTKRVNLHSKRYIRLNIPLHCNYDHTKLLTQILTLFKSTISAFETMQIER